VGLLSLIVSNLPEIPAQSQSLYTADGVQYDYAIGGLPFNSAANPDRPVIRQTAPYRKEQVDTSTSPGEQSLVSWWLRSQNSFHGGAGALFEEPDPNDPTIQYRFHDSVGLDVWTPGRVTLLKATSLAAAATDSCLIAGGNDRSADCWVQADGTTLQRITAGGAVSAVTWGGSGTIVDLASDGTNYYASDNVGIWQGTLAGGAGSKIWNTGSSNVVARWAKQRLVAGIGNKFYELVGTGPSLPATANYTHPDANWKWSAIAESPSAILAAGYSGTQSAIFKFVLDTSGTVPVLTSGIVTAELPVGEYVTAMFTYLGSYVAIGTNRGVRIATIDENGDVQYGPLSVDFSTFGTAPSAPVYAFAGKDRFIYFTLSGGIDGESGLGRIDLATQVAFGRYAWATDLQAHVTGTARGVLVAGTTNRLVLAVDAAGSYFESDSTLETTGYLQTGNIRFHTLESKLFKYAQIRCATILGGSIDVAVIDHDGNETTLVSFVTGIETSDDLALPVSLGQQEFISLKFTLTVDDDDPTLGPEFRSYQLKALPGAKRQRLIKLPLLCFDFESDRNGQSDGYEGRAKDRMNALEQLEEAADVVSWQDLTRDPFENRLVVIDDITFVQTEPPKSASGWGGVVEVTLRTVT
jgi:hypothetical protein